MPSPAGLRAFVRRHTRLQPVPDLPGLRLYLAGDVTTVWRRTGDELGLADPPLPYWAFAWSGGLAIARYLVDHPDEVAGHPVVDVASGSGMCAIVALRSGAASAHAVDVDPFAEAAVALNAPARGRLSPTSGHTCHELACISGRLLPRDVTERASQRSTVMLNFEYARLVELDRRREIAARIKIHRVLHPDGPSPDGPSTTPSNHGRLSTARGVPGPAR